MPSRLLDSETLEKLLTLQNELIASEPDMGSLMDLVVRRTQALVGAEGVAVELAEGTDMVYRAVSGLAAPQLGLRIPRQGSFSGLCVDTKETLVCQDAETDPRVNREACRAVGLRSMVVQPLFHHQTPIGILKVMSSQPAGLSSQVPVALGLVSQTVAGVLANALRWGELKAHAENLSHLASHDAMTGVGNRSAFYDRLRQAIAQARRTGTHLGVALFDLDGLKAVNDTHGHQAGDLFIRTFAERLTRQLRQTDSVSRLGGDEFGVVFPLEDDPQAALALGRRWADQASGPLKFGNAELKLQASAGVSVFADDGDAPESLVAKADERLYRDKRSRRGV